MWSRYVMSQVKHNSYFIVGLVAGLWVSLAVIPLEEDIAGCAGVSVDVAATHAGVDEFEPHREEKPLGSGGQTAGRSVQRPRYYSTELGMRGSLLAGVLSSEDALKIQVPALNRTLARLQPALKFFITASAMSSVPGLANVVGFTDTREMLKPFHALKYLADNYLEEYDFFFLVSDGAFVNARQLTALVGRLSVSQDLYMGTVAEGDTQYCSLDSGILLSNSVLRGIHNELEWCVRNSYSPHHHENIGRCVLHAAHVPCTPLAQGQVYQSLVLDKRDEAAGLVPALADAVTARPAAAEDMHRLHAYVSRVYLERDRAETARLRAYMWRNSARHPPHYRNATWPAGLRHDPGLAAPPPENRFSHLRWTLCNRTHAFMPDEVHAVAPLSAATRDALELVLENVRAWALRRWSDAGTVELVEGAWQWEPAAALRYRLLLRLTSGGEGGEATLRQVEVVRALGAARLVPVRYVTESARVTLVLAVPTTALHLHEALAFLQRYEQQALLQDKNTHLYVVCVGAEHNSTAVGAAEGALREALAGLAARHRQATLELLQATAGLGAGEPEAALLAAAGREALLAVAGKVPKDALLLLAPPHLEFSQDFLNRVRMNTIPGEQWFSPLPFARHAQYAHPAFLTPAGTKPQVHTGRFRTAHSALLAVCSADLAAALAAWRGSRGADVSLVLSASPLRVVRAPEPGCVLQPRPAPCDLRAHPHADTDDTHAEPTDQEREETRACLSSLREEKFASLDLGARNSLAQLLLQTLSDAE